MQALAVWAALFVSAAASAAPFKPAPQLDFFPSPETLDYECRAAKRRAGTALRTIATLSAVSRTLENTAESLDWALWRLSDDTASNQFLKYVSTSAAVRKAAHECETLIEKYIVGAYSRKDLYAALQEYAAKKAPLQGEAKRLLAKQLLDFKRSGLALKPRDWLRVKEIRQQLVELTGRFGKNLNEVTDSLSLYPDQLDGMPEDFIARLKKDKEGRLKVTLDYPDYFPFMNSAIDQQARRNLERLFADRAHKENLPILEKVLDLRYEAAELLGYKSHAHFVLEERMAHDPKTVSRFIKRLRKRLRPLAKKELALMRGLKKKEGAQDPGVIHEWDWRYYDTLVRKTRYEIDQNEIKEYFPLDVVTSGMLGVYETLLGVKFRKITGASVWHPDVTLYEVKNAGWGGKVVGYFYMDLFPRAGKYKHAAAFTLVKGRRLPEGTYQKPVSAMVATFNKPRLGKPSLLTHGEHGEVETYFHEFGHIMHQILTKARYGRFSGTEVALDFVEAPSQMLENWVWQPEVLEKISGHYKDHSKKLPDDLLKKMLAARNVDSGIYNLRQLFFGQIDQNYHSARHYKDTTKEWSRLVKIIRMIPMSARTHPEASFGHLMGYDAGYYGYLWSKVFAQDMFSRFETAGVLSPAIGRIYRESILEPGSSRDATELLRAFLGRDPDESAFLNSIGLIPED